jgi:hypothetical protein
MVYTNFGSNFLLFQWNFVCEQIHFFAVENEKYANAPVFLANATAFEEEI